MFVKVRLLRHNGRLLRRDEQIDKPAFVGNLSVMEARDAELNRPVVRARLLHATGTADDLLPELSDAHLLWLQDKKLRLSGFESIEAAAYAQTWSVEML